MNYLRIYLLAIIIFNSLSLFAQDISICLKQFQKVSRNLNSDIHPLFRSEIKNNAIIKYYLNLDRVEKKILSYSEKYKNQLLVKSLGNYDGHNLYRLDLQGWGNNRKKRIVISAGAHGNESAGVATVLEFLEKNIYNPKIRNNFDIVLFPYLNPGGLENNVRRLNNGIDLNRTFKIGKEQGPTRMLQNSLIGETFDIALDLHEAPFRDKFFVIKSAKDDNNITRNVLSKLDENVLVTSKNGEYPGIMTQTSNPQKKAYDLYAPGEVSSMNSGTIKGFYHQQLKVKYSYTVEAPGQFDLKEKISIYDQILGNYFDELLSLK